MAGSLYRPFFADMMGGIADRSKEKRTAGLARDAYMGDPKALEDLVAADPKLGMQVENQKIKREEKAAQQEMRDAEEQRRVAGEQRDVETHGIAQDDAFQADITRFSEAVAEFPDFESSKSYGDRGLAYLRQKYPERFAEGELSQLPDQFDQDAFNEISTAAGATSSADAGNEQRFFESMIADLSPEAQREAMDIKLGRKARATGSAELTALTEGLTDALGDHRAIVNEKAKFGEKTGASRAKAIDDGFDAVQKIDKNIRNLDKAIEALDADAGTGAVEQLFPSFKAATIELENVQQRLGLDVIGSVTFGALSEGELQLALETAMPTGLDEPELRKWIVDRKAAQSKLRDYYIDQMEFLEEGGTVAGFLRQKKKTQKAGGDFPGAPAVGAVVDGYKYTGGDPNSEASWEAQ